MFFNSKEANYVKFMDVVLATGNFFSFLLAFQYTDRAGATYIYQEHGTWYELKVSQLSNFLIWFACSANSSLNEE